MEIASCHRLLVRPIDAAITESDSKQSSEKLLICTKLDGPFQQARVLWTGMLRPSLSQNWIARKFEKAKTIAASYRTTSCHARLDHLHDVRRCKRFTTLYIYTVGLYTPGTPRSLAPLSDVTRNRAQTGRSLGNFRNSEIISILTLFLRRIYGAYLR